MRDETEKKDLRFPFHLLARSPIIRSIYLVIQRPFVKPLQMSRGPAPGPVSRVPPSRPGSRIRIQRNETARGQVIGLKPVYISG